MESKTKLLAEANAVTGRVRRAPLHAALVLGLASTRGALAHWQAPAVVLSGGRAGSEAARSFS
jgi:hypothetical protein